MAYPSIVETKLCMVNAVNGSINLPTVRPAVDGTHVPYLAMMFPTLGLLSLTME